MLHRVSTGLIKQAQNSEMNMGAPRLAANLRGSLNSASPDLSWLHSSLPFPLCLDSKGGQGMIKQHTTDVHYLCRQRHHDPFNVGHHGGGNRGTFTRAEVKQENEIQTDTHTSSLSIHIPTKLMLVSLFGVFVSVSINTSPPVRVNSFTETSSVIVMTSSDHWRRATG